MSRKHNGTPQAKALQDIAAAAAAIGNQEGGLETASPEIPPTGDACPSGRSLRDGSEASAACGWASTEGLEAPRYAYRGEGMQEGAGREGTEASMPHGGASAEGLEAPRYDYRPATGQEVAQEGDLRPEAFPSSPATPPAAAAASACEGAETPGTPEGEPSVQDRPAPAQAPGLPSDASLVAAAHARSGSASGRPAAGRVVEMEPDIRRAVLSSPAVGLTCHTREMQLTVGRPGHEALFSWCMRLTLLFEERDAQGARDVRSLLVMERGRFRHHHVVEGCGVALRRFWRLLLDISHALIVKLDGQEGLAWPFGQAGKDWLFFLHWFHSCYPVYGVAAAAVAVSGHEAFDALPWFRHEDAFPWQERVRRRDVDALADHLATMTSCAQDAGLVIHERMQRARCMDKALANGTGTSFERFGTIANYCFDSLRNMLPQIEKLYPDVAGGPRAACLDSPEGRLWVEWMLWLEDYWRRRKFEARAAGL